MMSTDNDALGSTPVLLTVVSTADEIRENIRRFARDFSFHRERAESLLRQTKYWVVDSDTLAFGPSKFLGYRNMSLARYERAVAGNAIGDEFNGAVTRKAIESVLGPYAESDEMAAMLNQWCETLLGPGCLSTIDQTKWRFTRIQTRRKYWAALCRPDHFAGLQAVRHLDELEWTVDRGDPVPGDRVLIWQAKGGGDRRGVIAFTEVETAPRVIECPPEEACYWLVDREEPARRVKLRVLPVSGLPLWETDHPELLGSLAVARARGGTVFSLESDQWHKLLSLAGAVEEPATRPLHESGQGIVIDAATRRSIELHAQSMVEEYYLSMGYTVTDVSKTKPYDLHCESEERTVRVEVKGTTGSGESIILTRNEVKHAKSNKSQVALAVVRGIELRLRDGEPTAEGGEMQIIDPWDINESALEATQYEYRV